MSWQVSPATGDYLMTNGRPIDDASLIYPAYYRLTIGRGRWLHAPDNSKYGSDLHMIRRRFNGQQLQNVSAVAQRALQPIVDDGRAKSAVVLFSTQQQVNRNEIALVANLTSTANKQEVLVLPPIGA